MNNKTEETKIIGISGAPGIAVGKLYIYRRDRFNIKKEIIPDQEIDNEIKKFREAVFESVSDITNIKRGISKRIDSEVAGILEAQIKIIDDVELNKKVEETIREEKISADYIYNRMINEVIESLEQSKSEYLRQRVFDLKGIRSKVLSYLRGRTQKPLGDFHEPVIVAARTLSAGEVAQMADNNVIGLITSAGGATSHTAILAKSLNIPAVLGIEEKYELLRNEMSVVVDGYGGKVIINPGKIAITDYCTRQLGYSREQEQLLVERDQPAFTLDKHRVNLYANIELVSEVEKALDVGAEGIGLYRSEFMYFTQGGLPSEEKQYKIYSMLAEKMDSRPVTIRTFDLGGDKFIDETHRSYEANPFLGWRAIRISLSIPEYFTAQLRAILRASVHGNVSIMIPMVSNVDEVKKSLEFLDEVKDEMMRKGMPFDKNIKFGVMIEVPSAAINANSIAGLVDFFSIGTNDLTQYTLAVDRGNEVISDIFQCYDPAVLKLTSMAIDAAEKASIPVSICGELAADPLATILLVGLKATALSVPFASLPQVKNVVRNIRFSKAQEIAKKALGYENATELRGMLANYLTERFEGSSNLV
ncbi:MAG: phosphoenolpyruvate--protein phosphotransferase [candidate division Zixibacteria bacterium]|nr:phosphoenolpyruvate--protein phosphotransferase [candidate division Zixibacteria bacterium]